MDTHGFKFPCDGLEVSALVSGLQVCNGPEKIKSAQVEKDVFC